MSSNLIRKRQSAELVDFTPSAGIASNNVQAAIVELLSDIAAPSGASLAGYQTADIGSTPATVEAKLRAISNTPEDKGALSAGGDDSAAFQAAINATMEGGLLTLQAGHTYKANTLKIAKSICIDLNGATVQSTAYASGMSKKIFYTDPADAVKWVTIKDGKLDGVGTNRGDTASEMESLVDLDTVQSVKIKSVEVFNHAAGTLAIPTALRDRKIGCVTIRHSDRVKLEDVVVHDNWNEQIHVYSDYGSECYTQVSGLISYHGTINQANTPIEITGGLCKVSDCNLRDTNASVMNFQATTSAIIVNNTIINNSGDGYGINFGQDGLTGYTDNVLIQGNYIEGTYRGGISVLGSNVKIFDNILRNPGGFGIKMRAVYDAVTADALLAGYPAMTHKHLTDLQICRNTILDTAYSQTIEGSAIYVSMTDTGYAWKNVKIENNRIGQPGANVTKNMHFGIYLSEVIDAEVIGNSITDATLSAINVAGAAETLTIKRNKFNSSAWNMQTDTTIEFYAPGRNFSNVTIEENEFNTRPLPNRYDIYMEGGIPTDWKIKNNKGILQGYAGLAGVVDYVKDDYPQKISIPTSGTFNLYDTVRSVPTASGVEGWVNTFGRGTLGTLNAGATTGTMTAGSNTLTVSSAAGITVGQIVSVLGAIGTGTGAVILDIAGLTVKLSVNAGASVANVAVAYVNPVFKTVGAIGA